MVQTLPRVHFPLLDSRINHDIIFPMKIHTLIEWVEEDARLFGVGLNGEEDSWEQGCMG